MTQRALTLVAAAIVALVGGCSLAGTWKTVSVEPQGKETSFPLSMVTFDDNNMTYTASSSYGNRAMTSTGKYDWSWGTLTIIPEGKPERTYKGTLWWGTKLVLKHEHEGEKMKATLEKVPVPK